MGGAESPRLSGIFVSGVPKKSSEPEAVGKFILGVQRA